MGLTDFDFVNNTIDNRRLKQKKNLRTNFGIEVL